MIENLRKRENGKFIGVELQYYYKDNKTIKVKYDGNGNSIDMTSDEVLAFDKELKRLSKINLETVIQV